MAALTELSQLPFKKREEKARSKAYIPITRPWQISDAVLATAPGFTHEPGQVINNFEQRAEHL